MPPRHHYWTIILEGKPTAFRAHTQDELMPTLRQLQARHPDAVLKWFARGRLWDTQEAERAEAAARRRPRAAPAGDRRGRDWRPGGEHQDPRDRFKVPRDEKRRRFAANLRRDRNEGEARPDRPAPFDKNKPFDRPPSNRPQGRFDRPRPDRPPGFDRARPDRSTRPDRPPVNRPPQAERPPGSGRPPRFDRAGKSPWRREEEGSRERDGAKSPAGASRFGKPRPPRPPGGRKPGGGGKAGGGGRGGGRR